MRIRSLIAATVVSLSAVAASAAPSAALIPANEAGSYKPKPPNICSWNCVYNNYPGAYNKMQNQLDKMDFAATQKILQAQIALQQSAKLVAVLSNMMKHTEEIKQAVIENMN